MQIYIAKIESQRENKWHLILRDCSLLRGDEFIVYCVEISKQCL